MYFNSLAFLAFFPCFFALYWLLRGSLRVFLCLVGSYIFYGWWDYRFLTLIVISTLVDYAVGRLLGESKSMPTRRSLLAVSILSNLGILATFKYFNFFADSLQVVVSAFGFSLDWPTLHIILPAGISFYTFQTLSYSIDVYRGHLQPERNLMRFAAFVSFFPQLVAGPIVRAHEFLPQISTDRRFDWAQFESGFGRVLQGFFKKLVIADSIAFVADPMFADPRGYSAINTLVIVVLYSFQVYCDFSGYCDIAIGLAKMLGFELPENFRFPYFATSPSDFWHRWHITLSTWLRDYVYIPLGGDRVSEWNTYRNLFITMLLGGLWHGASWNFIIWGAIHAVILVLHRFVVNRSRLTYVSSFDRAVSSTTPHPFVKQFATAMKCLTLFGVICITWVFFRSGTFSQAVQILSQIVSLDGLSPSTLQNRIPLLKTCGLVAMFVSFELTSKLSLSTYVVTRMPVARAFYYASLLWLIALVGTFSGTQFIYFQF